ncbi:MAG: hypothetical protein IKG52_15665 [Rhodobacteraceae bacterium]|nr:hypothetical protein [Paracoccaceae bacterium]
MLIDEPAPMFWNAHAPDAISGRQYRGASAFGPMICRKNRRFCAAAAKNYAALQRKAFKTGTKCKRANARKIGNMFRIRRAGGCPERTGVILSIFCKMKAHCQKHATAGSGKAAQHVLTRNFDKTDA